jgi:FAD/FMN-containing dehydrogenase
MTVGGALAIDAHGTAVPTPPDDAFPASYGSMSNQILDLTALVTDPNSPNPTDYTLRMFQRGEDVTRAFLTHAGRALVIEATLQVVDNYNLRRQSFTDIHWQTLFAKPEAPPSTNRFADLLNRYGRVEIIKLCALPAPAPDQRSPGRLI